MSTSILNPYISSNNISSYFPWKDLPPKSPPIESSPPLIDSPPSPSLQNKRVYSRQDVRNEISRSNNIRKCSYALAVLDPDLFMEQGAVKVEDGLYILKRKYDGSVYGETCAIVGISRANISQILDSTSDLYTTLRNQPLLANIPGIKDLSPHRLNPLKYMIKYLYFVYKREIILFNIEPKGLSGNKEKLYPCANLCLPGGGMEVSDESCWESCMRREFSEEVGFAIPKGSDYQLITKQKFAFSDRQVMYFWIRCKKL